MSVDERQIATLMPLVYDELRRIAARYMRQERPGQTIQATGLVNEAYVRMAADRPREPREFAVWCSQRDAVQMIERCLTAPPSVRFDVFFAASRNRWGYRDLSHARAVLGFDPQDAAEDHRHS